MSGRGGMEQGDLQALIGDSRFKKYHAETTKGKVFNPFDVLRYSGYEIRHSNVLAWLFQPNETHGIGDAFIQGFTRAMNDGARSQEIPQVAVPSSFDSADVRVERERDYVDITLLFRNDRNQRVVIAIENKIEETDPEHGKQVGSYEEIIRKKYEGEYDILQSVLLTTSPTADADERRFIHVSWNSIRDIVKQIRKPDQVEGDAAGRNVHAFLGHYLEVLERFTVQVAGDDHFRSLVDDYRPLLIKLLKNSEGEGITEDSLPEGLGSQRSTVARFVNDFRQEPERLRRAVRSFLKRKGFGTSVHTPRKGGQWFFLYFGNESMGKTRDALGLLWQPQWSVAFGRNVVLVELDFHLDAKKLRPIVDRVTKFIKRALPLLWWAVSIGS